MPIEHTVDRERRLVRSRLWDIVTESEAWASVAALMDDPAFEPTFVQLSDMREVTEVQVSGSTIRELAQMRIFHPGVRRAMVVATGLQSGIGRMTTSYAAGGDQELALFTSVPEALAWLGVDGLPLS
jgi:hypothetical protein